MWLSGAPLPIPRGSLGIAGAITLRPWRSGLFSGGTGGGANGGSASPIGVPRSASAGFQPAPTAGLPALTITETASRVWVRQVAEATNNILAGKLNATLLVTLAPNVASTTVTDVRISAYSAILFTPLTANAAAELASGGLYVSNRKAGEATIAHANGAQTDREFNMLIIG